MTERQKEPQTSIIEIRDQLKAQFIERDEQIDGTICAILSKQHLFMVGPPGTAKSMLTDEICRRIEGADYFQWLLTKFSTPEEIFGPISLKALENDEYKRITHNKLPEAHIAFLDECFKANSAILNSLLTLVNERKYHNNGTPVNVPLQSLFGASNELPEGEELGALYDRFILRYVVPYIADDNDFKNMLLMDGNARSPITITTQDLKANQEAAMATIVPDEILDLVIQIRNELKKEGVINSDRRYKQSLDILKAHAYINGRKAVGEEDLTILQHILWSQPAEIKTVNRVIIGTSNPLMNKIMEILDQAHEIEAEVQKALKDDPDQASASGVEANTKLKKLGEQLQVHRETAETQGKSTGKIDDTITKVADINKQVLHDCLGFDI
ncbi:MAG: AAA domain-containing protein [ANME-2 cluster archaeon]|nr:AAA domain-containing protein [ANME-2 cluster archaeon]